MVEREEYAEDTKSLSKNIRITTYRNCRNWKLGRADVGEALS